MDKGNQEMTTDQEKMEIALAQVEMIMRKSGVKAHFIAAMSSSGASLISARGDLSDLVSGVIDSLYQANPDGAVVFLTQILKAAGAWFGLHGEERVMH